MMSYKGLKAKEAYNVIGSTVVMCHIASSILSKYGCIKTIHLVAHVL